MASAVKGVDAALTTAVEQLRLAQSSAVDRLGRVAIAYGYIAVALVAWLVEDDDDAKKGGA